MSDERTRVVAGRRGAEWEIRDDGHRLWGRPCGNNPTVNLSREEWIFITEYKHCDVPSLADVVVDLVMTDANGWLPISTAPRDGSEFQARTIFEGSVDTEERCRFNLDTGEFEIWVDYDCLGWSETNSRPIDWQLLPPPPAQEGAGDE